LFSRRASYGNNHNDDDNNNNNNNNKNNGGGNNKSKSPPVLAKQLSGFDLQTKNESYLNGSSNHNNDNHNNGSASSWRRRSNDDCYYDDEEGCPRASFGSGTGSHKGRGSGRANIPTTAPSSSRKTTPTEKRVVAKSKSSALRMTHEAKSYIVDKLSSLPVISGQSCRKKYGPEANSARRKNGIGTEWKRRIRSRSRSRSGNGWRYRPREDAVAEEEEEEEEKEEDLLPSDENAPRPEQPPTTDRNVNDGNDPTPSGRRPTVTVTSSSRGNRVYLLHDDEDDDDHDHVDDHVDDHEEDEDQDSFLSNHSKEEEEDDILSRSSSASSYSSTSSTRRSTDSVYSDHDDSAEEDARRNDETERSRAKSSWRRRGHRGRNGHRNPLDRRPPPPRRRRPSNHGKEENRVLDDDVDDRQSESSFVEDDLISSSSSSSSRLDRDDDDYDDDDDDYDNDDCDDTDRSRRRRSRSRTASKRRNSSKRRTSSQCLGDSRPTIDYDMSHLDDERQERTEEEVKEEEDSVISGAQDLEDSRADVVVVVAAAPSRKSSSSSSSSPSREKKKKPSPPSTTSDLDTTTSDRSYQLFQIRQENEALRANVNALRKDWETILRRMNSVDTAATTVGDTIDQQDLKTAMKMSDIDFNVSYLSLNTNLKTIQEIKSKAMTKLNEQRKKEKEFRKRQPQQQQPQQQQEQQRLSLSQQEKDFRQSYEACIEDLLCENERLFGDVIALSEERREILEEVRTLRDASVENHVGLLTDEDMAQMHRHCLKHIDDLLRGIRELAPSELQREKAKVMGEGILKLVSRIMTQRLEEGSVVEGERTAMEESDEEDGVERADEEKKEEEGCHGIGDETDRTQGREQERYQDREQDHDVDNADDVSVTSSTASVLGNNDLALTTVENDRRSSHVSSSSKGSHRPNSNPKQEDDEEYEDEEEYSDESSSGYDEYEVIEEYYTDSEEEYEEEVDYQEDYGDSFLVNNNNMSTNSLFDSSSPHVSFGMRYSRNYDGSAESCGNNSQSESTDYIRPGRPDSFLSGTTHSTDVQDPPRGYHPSFYSSSSSATEDFQTGGRHRHKYNQSFVSTSSHFSSIKEDYAEDSEEDEDERDEASSQYSGESGSYSSEGGDSSEWEEESYYEYPDDEDVDEVRTNYDEPALAHREIHESDGSSQNDVPEEAVKHNDDEYNDEDDPASFTKPHYGYQTQATCSESCSASDYDNDTIPSMGSESTKENKGISLTVVIRSSRYMSFPSTKEHSIVSFFTSSLVKSQVDAVLEEQFRESMAALDSMMSVQTETTQRTGSLSSTRSKRKQKKKKYQGEFNGTGERHGYGIYISKNGNEYRGEWQHNKREGLGVVKVGNGDVFEGQFENNMKNGIGVYHYSDGECDLSLYLDDTRVGNTFRWSVDRRRAFVVSSEEGMREVSLNEAARLAREIGVVVA